MGTSENRWTLTESMVRKWLRVVIDPELGMNIVDLGLVYGIDIDGHDVTVRMTLTTPGCPASDAITGGIREVLATQAAVENVDIELVWYPTWDPGMMSDEAKKALWGS